MYLNFFYIVINRGAIGPSISDFQNVIEGATVKLWRSSKNENVGNTQVHQRRKFKKNRVASFSVIMFQKFSNFWRSAVATMFQFSKLVFIYGILPPEGFQKSCCWTWLDNSFLTCEALKSKFLKIHSDRHFEVRESGKKLLYFICGRLSYPLLRFAKFGFLKQCCQKTMSNFRFRFRIFLKSLFSR